MQTRTKAKLTEKLQEWLDDEEVGDDLGGTDGIWQDNTTAARNANVMADAVENVINAMALQSELEEELNRE